MVVGQHLPLHGVKVGGAEEARDLVEKLDDALLRLTVAERHDVGLGGIEEVAAARHDDGSGKRGVPEAKGAVEDAAGIVPDGTMTNDGRSQHDERTKNNGHERWANPGKGVVARACARNSRGHALTINGFLKTPDPLHFSGAPGGCPFCVPLPSVGGTTAGRCGLRQTFMHDPGPSIERAPDR